MLAPLLASYKRSEYLEGPRLSRVHAYHLQDNNAYGILPASRSECNFSTSPSNCPYIYQEKEREKTMLYTLTNGPLSLPPQAHGL